MKRTTCKVNDERFKKATKVLDDWRFIYELTSHGNLRAEPMDYSINDRLIKELGRAGYHSLPGRGFLIISPLTENEIITCIN